MDLFLVIFLSLIGLIDYRIRGFNYWDEFILIIGLILYLVHRLSSKKRPEEHRFQLSVSWIFIALLFVGLLGNILHPDFQNNKLAMVKDVIALSKFPILMVIAPILMRGKVIYKNIILMFCKGYLLTLFFFSLIGYFVNIGVYIDDSSKLFRTFQFYYQHCTFMVSTVLCMVAIMISTGCKKHRIYIILGCFVMIMSQRTKAIFISVMILLLLIVGVERLSFLFKKSGAYLRTKRKYIFPATLIIVVMAWFIARHRVILFWKYGLSSARPALYITGIKIARDMFPIGSGLASFASSLSGEYYSGIYAKYGISGVLGLTKESFSYMADAFPPYIYGQFGLLGFILFIRIIIILIMQNIRVSSNYNILAAVLIIWLYILFACTAETIFTNTTSVLFAFIINLILKIGKGEAS